MEPQTTPLTYADGYKVGYQDAKAFYTRRDNHARTVARHWRAVADHPKGPRSIEVLTMLFPELVRTLDAMAVHALDHPQS